MSKWILDMKAEPIVPAWTNTADCSTNGAELQRAIILGFSKEDDPRFNSFWKKPYSEFVFEKTFTFKEHGQFFLGALTMAGLRHTGDFYELLKRYETIKVTIVKSLQGDD